MRQSRSVSRQQRRNTISLATLMSLLWLTATTTKYVFEKASGSKALNLKKNTPCSFCEAFSFRNPSSTKTLRSGAIKKTLSSSSFFNDKHDSARVDKQSTVPNLSKTSLCLNSIGSGGDVQVLGRWKLRRERLARSFIAAASCVITWMLAKSKYNLTPVQASSVVGISGCLLSSPLAVASFCGSFAGMSSQIVSMKTAWLLGALCATTFYVCESGNKLLVGKGGRLGTIAFGGSIGYFVLFQNGLSRILQNISHLSKSHTAGIVLLSAALLQYLRTEGIDKPKVAAQSAWAKFLILSIMLIELFGGVVPSDSALKAYLQVAAAIFGGSYIVKRSNGFVLPAAVVGLVGSYLFPALAAPIYLGSFVGMTGLSKFDEWNLLQSSIFAAALYQLGFFTGFGGRLGFLAFLGVNFGM